jgi:hypothetical protein
MISGSEGMACLQTPEGIAGCSKGGSACQRSVHATDEFDALATVVTGMPVADVGC